MTPAGDGPTEGTGDAEDSTSDSLGGTQPRSGPPSIGPLAVEAALLLDVMADRLTSMRPPGEPDSTPADESPPESPPDPPPDPPPAPPTPPAAPPSASRTPPRATQARSVPTLGPDGRCPECGAIPGASCTACPLCRFLAVLRGERPEATARLVDGALLIVRTLRSLLPEAEQAATASSSGSAGSGEQRQGPTTPSARRPGGLEHIDIR